MVVCVSGPRLTCDRLYSGCASGQIYLIMDSSRYLLLVSSLSSLHVVHQVISKATEFGAAGILTVGFPSPSMAPMLITPLSGNSQML